MKIVGYNKFFLLLLFGLFLSKYAFSQSLHWAAKMGGIGTDLVNGLSTDKEGNVYVAGSFSLNAKIGRTEMVSQGGGDFFVAKFSEKGQLIWYVQGGGTNDDFATSLHVDAAGQVYAAGVFTDSLNVMGKILNANGANDIFVVCINKEGQVKWIQGLGSGGSALPQAIVSRGGIVYVAGVFTTSLGLNNLHGYGETDAFIGSFSETGQINWIRSGGGPGFEEVKSLTTLDDGQVVLTGRFMNYAYFGDYRVKGGDNPAVFVCAYNPMGKLNWVQKIAGVDAEIDILSSASFGSSVFLAGKVAGVASIADLNIRSTGMFDALLLKLQADGTPIVISTSEGQDDEVFQHIEVDDEGKLFAVGTFRKEFEWGRKRTKSDGDNNIVQLVLDEQLKVEKIHSMSLTPDVVDNCYALHKDGSWLVAGYFKEKKFFRKDYFLVALGEEDIFLQKTYFSGTAK